MTRVISTSEVAATNTFLPGIVDPLGRPGEQLSATDGGGVDADRSVGVVQQRRLRFLLPSLWPDQWYTRVRIVLVVVIAATSCLRWE